MEDGVSGSGHFGGDELGQNTVEGFDFLARRPSKESERARSARRARMLRFCSCQGKEIQRHSLLSRNPKKNEDRMLLRDSS